MSPFYHNPIPNTSGIYRITCTSTGKIYVGSAIHLASRWRHHLYVLERNMHHNPKLQRAFNKYGRQNFIFEVLELVPIPEMLTIREQYWIEYLNPFEKNGFNILHDANSALGLKHSPESRAKRSKRQQGKQPWLGKTHTPETREKMRLAALKRHQQSPLSKESREKLSATKTGYKPDPKIYDDRRKTLIVTAPDGTEYLVHGIRKFCEEHQVNRTGLMRVAKGKQSQCKGWIARFPD